MTRDFAIQFPQDASVVRNDPLNARGEEPQCQSLVGNKRFREDQRETLETVNEDSLWYVDP